jgi:hypothetical protein
MSKKSAAVGTGAMVFSPLVDILVVGQLYAAAELDDKFSYSLFWQFLTVSSMHKSTLYTQCTKCVEIDSK